MNYFRIKNWNVHQHYKDRRPPWIKLHNSLFDDYEFQGLPDDSKCHLVMVWLLASRATDYIDSNTLARCYKEKNDAREPILPEDEQYLTRQAGLKRRINLKPLFSAGFLIRYQDASDVLAKCYTETEAYKEETEGETEVFSPPDMSDAWNERVDGSDLPRVIRLTTDRRKKCLARIKSLSLTPEKWNSVLDGVYASDFLTGKNDRKWIANFDWLIRNDENIVKVVEGGYR